MKNLFKIRMEKKMSQVNLSTKLGVSQETISAYESGRSYPSVEMLLKLCNTFNVSSDFLLDKTDVRMPVNKLIIENLNNNELEILSIYRELTVSKKERALGILIGLKD